VNTDKATVEKVLSCIKKENLIQLVTDLVNIPSPGGREGEVGEYILGWMKQHGLQTVRQVVAENRINAIGILPGQGKGPSLIFNGHTDTVYSGSEEDAPVLGRGVLKQESIPRLYVKNNRLYGEGVYNDKGNVTAFLIAGQALKASGAKLRGDVILTAVVGEIERAPVGQYQGPLYEGGGHGTRYMLGHGITADYAIVAESSQGETGQFSLTWALPGAVYLKISTFGEAKYTPRIDRSKPHNAIENMAPIIESIKSWARDYEESRRYEFAGGVIIPKVNIGAIDGGLPYKPNYSPAICSIYVDVRIPPGITPHQIKGELDAMLRRQGCDVEITLYRSHRGFEADYNSIQPLVQAITEGRKHLLGAPPDRIHPHWTNTWNDLNAFLEAGIPTIKCGASPGLQVKGDERMSMDPEDLLTAARLYAIAALEICNGPLEESNPERSRPS
jgi:acetylornithine deacetylase/succinyl-diaminopimelate desuccinylase-like protein